jgi:hypothetical protein
VAHRCQFFDVLSALVEQGVGAGLLGEAFIRPEMRGEVELVWPFEPWRFMLRRSPRLRGRAGRRGRALPDRQRAQRRPLPGARGSVRHAGGNRGLIRFNRIRPRKQVPRSYSRR